MTVTWGRSAAAARRSATFGLAARRLASRLQAGLTASLAAEAERGRIFLWAPAAFAAGVLVYFALPQEPAAAWLGLSAAALALAALFSRRSAVAGVTLTGLALVAAGLLAARLRTDLVAAPVLWKRHGPVRIEGVVRRAERQEKAVRLVLDIMSVGGLDPARTPARVQITWRGGSVLPPPGARVAVRAVLMPPPGPVAPDAWHYGRDLFFRGVGATGFTMGAPVFTAGPEPGAFGRIRQGIDRVRAAVTARIRDALPGETGAVAAALLTGERAEIPKGANEALRASGLAHILSISGMHMSLFAGWLYVAARFALAAFPGFALRWPIRASAATIGLAGAAFYLLLSGGGVPAERSWIMISIMFAALIAGRRALTMRNVALAALVILALEPESVLSASFQMSFAATVALIAAYESAGGRFLARRPGGALLRPLRYASALAATSLVAGAATGVFGVFHFHAVASYGLVGNLLAMPALAAMVMPAGMLALALMPFGLEALALAAMGEGIEWVLFVARAVGSWPGATLPMPGLTAEAALAASLSGLWLCLWRARWRLIGLAGLALALTFGAPERPDLIVEADGRTLALRRDDGRLAVAGLRSGRFAAGRWLEADGDPRSLSDPSLTQGVVCDRQACRAAFRDGSIVALVLARDGLEHWCREAAILVSPWIAPQGCAARVTIDGAALAEGGAHAIYGSWNEGYIAKIALAPHRPWDRWALAALAERRLREQDGPAGAGDAGAP